MSGLLGTNNKQVTKYTGLSVQTSALNIPVTLFWGQRRLAWNLIWQADFTAHKQKSSGGKGGGGKGATSYTYTVAVIMALAEGVVSSIGTVWQNQSATTLSAVGLTLFTGTATQTPWSYVPAKHPSQALSYANTAYLASSALQLGSTPALPQLDFECTGNLSGTMPGTPDVNLADVIPDFLTNAQYGMGLAITDLNYDDLIQFKSYQQAQGLFFSPALISQEKATDIIDRWAKLSNSWIFDSGAAIRLVPLGDSVINANGAAYSPVTTIQYDLTIADFLGDPPVKITRMDPADAPNRTTLQITDRALGYNSNPLEYRDQTLFDQYGLRDSNTQQADEIASAAVGQIVTDLIGQRAAWQRNSYAFTLPYKFMRLEPGDLVTLTDPNNTALTRLPVRIKTIEESADYSLAFTAEDYFGNATSGTPNSSTPQPSSPNTFNRLVDPGNVNTPCVLEPASTLTGGTAQVWISGSGGVNWGGALVFVSFDNVTYTQLGTIFGSARQGVLTAGLANHADPDAVDTLSVDLTESLGTLDPVTHADADAFRTLAYISAPPSGVALATTGELVAYGAVASTGTYTDDLTYLRRALYSTVAAAHFTNDLFTRLDLGASDTSIVKYDLPAQYVGQTIYIKLVSFNIYGLASQDISTVTTYTYTPTGAGFGTGTGGVPTTPATPTATTVSANVVLSWTANPSTDNVIRYDVYRAAGTGASFGSSSLIGSAVGTSYTDSTVAASTAYTYFIVAENSVGSSAASAGVSITSTGSGGAGSVSSVGALLDTSASSGSLTLPSYTAGDVCFIHLFSADAGGTAHPTTPPTGWTLVANVNANFNVVSNMVFRRVMDGSEGTTVAMTFAAGTSKMVRAITVHGAIAGGAITEGAATAGGAATGTGTINLVCANVTTSGANRMLLNFMGTCRGVTNTSAGTADAWTDIYQTASSSNGLNPDIAGSYQSAAAAGTYSGETRTKQEVSSGDILWGAVSFAIIMT